MLLILAIFTRIFGIEFQSLWIDEGSTYYYAHYTWEQFSAIREPNSPIYYMMEGVALDIFGHSEFALRAFSAIAGVITIIMAFLVTEKMFKNWRFATLVATLFLICTFCLEYAQEARGYALVLMLFLFQLYVLLYALETKKYVYWILLAILSAASFAMQYIAVLASITLYCYAFYVYYDDIKQKNFNGLKRILISGIILLVLTFPLWNFAIDAILNNGSNGHWEWCMQGPIYTAEVFYKFFNRIPILAIVMFLLMIKGAIYCYKTYRKEFILMMWIMLLPLGLTTILSIFFNITPRYIIWSIPSYLILLAFSFYGWGTDKETLKGANTTAVVSIILIAGISLPLYYMVDTKPDFRGAGEALGEYAEEGDILVYNPPSRNAIYATLSFYWVPEDHGVEAIGYESLQQLKDLSNTPGIGKIYVLFDKDHEPYDYMYSHQTETCKLFYKGYMMDIFVITGPMALNE